MKIGHRFPHQVNSSNTVIAKGLQNRQSSLFQLFDNVPWLPQAPISAPTYRGAFPLRGPGSLSVGKLRFWGGSAPNQRSLLPCDGFFQGPAYLGTWNLSGCFSLLGAAQELLHRLLQ